jgi:hypothetical protein
MITDTTAVDLLVVLSSSKPGEQPDSTQPFDQLRETSAAAVLPLGLVIGGNILRRFTYPNSGG